MTPQDGLVRVADVPLERLRWLWLGYLPAGKVVILDGDPGLGKSLVTCDLAARLSTGSPWPDGAPGGEPGNTLFLAAEDGIGDTIRPRLEAAGADLERCFVWTGVKDGDKERLPNLDQDRALMEQHVTRHKPKLVVIDPLMAHLGGGVDGHRDQDVRSVLVPLAQLAERTGVCVVAVRHLNKGGGGRAMYRGGGSIGIVGSARMAYVAARDPDDEGRVILAATKANIARLPNAQSFRVVEGLDGAPRVSWEGATGHRADDLMGSEDGGERSARQEAEEWLTDLLRTGAIPARDVQGAAKDAGIAWATVRRAADRMQVKKTKQGMSGGWAWSLPSNGLPVEGAQDAPKMFTPESAHLRPTLSIFDRSLVPRTAAACASCGADTEFYVNGVALHPTCERRPA